MIGTPLSGMQTIYRGREKGRSRAPEPTRVGCGGASGAGKEQKQKPWPPSIIRAAELNKPKRHHTPQLTNKMRKSIRPAIFIVAIDEPRSYWVLQELAILIELVAGVPLFLLCSFS